MRTSTVVLAIALALSYPSTASCQTAEAKAPSPEQFQVTRVETSDKEWALDFIDKEHVISKIPDKGIDGKETGFTRISYKVAKKVLTLPWISVNSRERSAVISQYYFEVQSALAIAKNGRVFAYSVAGTLVGGPEPNAYKSGADTTMVFYDMYGTGKFDTVRMFAGMRMDTPGGIPLVPDWIAKQ